MNKRIKFETGQFYRSGWEKTMRKKSKKYFKLEILKNHQFIKKCFKLSESSDKFKISFGFENDIILFTVYYFGYRFYSVRVFEIDVIMNRFHFKYTAERF